MRSITCKKCGKDFEAEKNRQKAQISWQDPPWNVAYGENVKPGNPQNYKVRKIQNDNLGDKFEAFVVKFCKVTKDNVEPGAALYMAMSAQEWPTIDRALRQAGFHWSSTLIWVKDHAVLSRKDYHTRFELIWYGWNADAPRLFPLADRKQNDVWEINRPTKSDEHPTMKPVQLVTTALANSSAKGSIVFEPFSGSGTTLIACENTGRMCRAIEISPGYVAVAIQRWKDVVGADAIPQLL